MELILPYAQKIITQVLKPGDVTIDCTCGNGYDTLFLAEHSDYVYAFDIQDIAIQNTKVLLQGNNFHNVKYINDSHENILNYINQPVKACMFNLGYLPNYDKNIHTFYETTYNAIINALSITRKDGIITIVLYPGTKKGLQEALYIETKLQLLPAKKYDIYKYQPLNRNNSPYLICIEKKFF